MKNWQKWLIIICIIAAAVLLVTFGFKLMFDFALGPLPTIVLVFVVYGLGRVWTRSPSTQTEPDAGGDEEK
ncbi:MAG TPA: hypothetical protein IAD33_04015 [Candidatus Scatomorpha gallistercoris]|nr:hypothetical protein [Candidatus Scatomorpha gallistercoris]